MSMHKRYVLDEADQMLWVDGFLAAQRSAWKFFALGGKVSLASYSEFMKREGESSWQEVKELNSAVPFEAPSESKIVVP